MLLEELKGGVPFGDLGRRWEDNTDMDLMYIIYEREDWIILVLMSLFHKVKNLPSIKSRSALSR
jgi:hypothetical protein